MRPVKYRFGSYVLTGLTAPALQAQVAAEGSLRQTWKARQCPCCSIPYQATLGLQGHSLRFFPNIITALPAPCVGGAFFCAKPLPWLVAAVQPLAAVHHRPSANESARGCNAAGEACSSAGQPHRPNRSSVGGASGG